MAPLPPKVDPPKDPALRGAIERLAVFVFRNGPLYEATAKKTHEKDPLYAFLFGGAGATYYAYRLAFFKVCVLTDGRHTTMCCCCSDTFTPWWRCAFVFVLLCLSMFIYC